MLLKLAILFCALFVTSSTQDFLTGPTEHHLNALFEQFKEKETVDADTKTFHNLTEAISATEAVFEKQMQKLHLPSLVVGLSVRNRTVFTKSWGLADIENRIPAVAEKTVYRMASISKTFTSVILGTLVNQGLVKYSDPISKYLPASVYPPKTWAGHQVNITVGQLLAHTSGVYSGSFNDFFTFNFNVTTVTGSLGQFSAKPLESKPGSAYAYSNYGYQLAGAVIEAVTEKPFPEVFAKFAAKHGLHNSYIDTESNLVPHKARFYRAEKPGSQQNVPTYPAEDIFMANGYWSAGGVLTTIPDLLTYGNLILDSYKGRPGALLTKETLSQMWTSQTETLRGIPPGTGYGYGWAITDLHNQSLINSAKRFKHHNIRWHNGGLPGATTFLVIYPEEEVVGVAFTNKGEAQGGLMIATMQAVENVYDFVK